MRSHRIPLRLRERGHHAADLGQTLEPADRGIAGKAPLADVVEQFVTVIRAERQAPALIAGLPAAGLLAQESLDHRHHVGISAEMLRFLERAVRLFRDIAEVDEMGVARKRLRHRRHVVLGAGAERADAEREPVGVGRDR